MMHRSPNYADIATFQPSSARSRETSENLVPAELRCLIAASSVLYLLQYVKGSW